MGLESIDVTGVYQDASGNALMGKTIKFTPLAVFGDEGIIVPRATIRVVSDNVDGSFEVPLLTSDAVDAYVRYQVEFHNGNRQKFDLTDDFATITLEDLINAFNGAAGASASVIITNHENRIDALELLTTDGPLNLIDPDYVGYAGSLDAPALFSVASNDNVQNNPGTVLVTDDWIGGAFDLKISATGAGKTLIGLLTQLRTGGAYTGSGTITGHRVQVNNRLQTGGATPFVYGSNVSVEIEGTATEAVAMVVNAFRGSTVACPKFVGLRATAANAYTTADEITAGEFIAKTISIGATSALHRALAVRVDNALDHTITDARGLSFDNWSDFGTVTTSYGIYADASINIGATSYFIYSLSTAESLFSGAVRGPINAYNAGTWNGSNKFATEGAVRNAIETIVVGSGLTGDGVASQFPYYTGTTTLAPAPMSYTITPGQPTFRWFHTAYATDEWVMQFQPGEGAQSGDFYIGHSGSPAIEAYLQFGSNAEANWQTRLLYVGDIEGNHNSTTLEISDYSGNFKFNGGSVDLGTNTKFRITTAQTPASATATGAVGQIAWDSGFLYVCVATDTWRRVAHATW